eukprot:gene2680-biopygen8643
MSSEVPGVGAVAEEEEGEELERAVAQRGADAAVQPRGGEQPAEAARPAAARPQLPAGGRALTSSAQPLRRKLC